MPVDQPPVPPISAETFDLRRLSSSEDKIDLQIPGQRCARGEMGDIVVCAPNQDKHRMRPLPGDDTRRVGLPKAQLDMGGGKSLGIVTEQATMQNGAASNRVMLKGSIKF